MTEPVHVHGTGPSIWLRLAAAFAFLSAGLSAIAGAMLLFTQTDHPIRLGLALFSALTALVMIHIGMGALRRRKSALWIALGVCLVQVFLSVPGVLALRPLSVLFAALPLGTLLSLIAGRSQLIASDSVSVKAVDGEETA